MAQEGAEEAAEIVVVPANEASWEDLRAVFGEAGVPAWCQCQWFKFPRREMDALDRSARQDHLREQTACGDPDAPSTSGLVAFLDGVPAGWCAVEPRTAYPRLRTSRLVWSGRSEDPDDAAVWAVTCFVTRKGYRQRGIGTALARAAAGFARDRGAAAVEGYPLLPRLPGAGRNSSGDLFVGSVGMFESAGFREVSRPTGRRAVMRLEW
ncbi:GNAT family N-acetyltransferase [Myceligenerans salitolerans]|uniref:GNAT family N-acetyltransferase n=1 Tax=Myceligenerans salitolerans TaxID=1230528 RepID=A0ABS3IDV7_9MICO|nr:GNAT family N-acetyltransferase [Myceligenerans salitolerans]MBO0611160.1 GNAT family N-acetyltransferase [Myceligenerans salitolerans]